MPLTLAETPLYYKDSQGQYHRVLSGADMTGYRTAAAQDAIDAGFAKTNEVGIVINGKRPGRNASAGQYVIVRNSTISGITDGLYVVRSGYTLSPSTDVTAANLTAVSNGGLNSQNTKVQALQDRFPTTWYNDFNALENVFQPVIFKVNQNSQHAPSAAAFVCIQFASSANYAVQLAFRSGSTDIFMRAKYAGTWGNWVSLTIS